MTIELIDLHPAPADLSRLVQAGLAQQPKQLPAWLLYDAEGSRLFAEFQQPEYHHPHGDHLLEQQATGIATAVGQGVVVEFGIGTARRSSACAAPAAFMALDISRTALETSLSVGAEAQDTLMLGICCDHSTLDALPDHHRLRGERPIGFPRRLAGELQPEDAVTVLKQFRRLLDGGPLLLGLDQPRDPSLLKAYNDAAGVSAAFAGICHRLNRDLNETPDRADFATRPMAAGAAPH